MGTYDCHFETIERPPATSRCTRRRRAKAPKGSLRDSLTLTRTSFRRWSSSPPHERRVLLKTRILPIIWMIVLAGCSQSTQPENPKWVDELIKRFQNAPVGNPPQSIWRYQFKGQVVYYVPPQCCDQFSSLYDINGNLICAPDGGFSGAGDGHCTDFFANRTNEKLVWKDPRGG